MSPESTSRSTIWPAKRVQCGEPSSQLQIRFELNCARIIGVTIGEPLVCYDGDRLQVGIRRQYSRQLLGRSLPAADPPIAIWIKLVYAGRLEANPNRFSFSSATSRPKPRGATSAAHVIASAVNDKIESSRHRELADLRKRRIQRRCFKGVDASRTPILATERILCAEEEPSGSRLSSHIGHLLVHQT